jgi:hypothetical protein
MGGTHSQRRSAFSVLAFSAVDQHLCFEEAHSETGDGRSNGSRQERPSAPAERKRSGCSTVRDFGSGQPEVRAPKPVGSLAGRFSGMSRSAAVARVWIVRLSANSVRPSQSQAAILGARKSRRRNLLHLARQNSEAGEISRADLGDRFFGRPGCSQSAPFRTNASCTTSATEEDRAN